ncbi:MAG: four-carbon acid sugar kinase family protein [Marmoricola sp.]
MGPAVTIVADDLSGANVTGALFARMGLRVRTVTASAAMLEESSDRPTGEADVTVVTTGTRTMPARAAARVVSDMLRSAPTLAGAPLLAKRVDTTLRGPVAAELEALLSYRRQPGSRVVAVAAPAYPSAGRTTVDGLHRLHGVPLADSPAGRDPLTPVHSSRVAELLTAGTGLQSEELGLALLRGGPNAAEVLTEAVARADVVVLDAETDGDLARAAELAARARQDTGVDIVPVDSGPFAAAYSAALGLVPQRSEAPVLLVVGSVAEPTTRQVEKAVESLGTCVVDVDPERDVDDLVRQTLRHLRGTGRDLCWKVAAPGAGLDARVAARIPRTLGVAARQVLEQAAVGGVFACGGEVAAALLDALEVHSLQIEGEVQPLVVTGRVHGGPWDRLPVITKGGFVGDDRAIAASIGRLHEMHEGLYGTAEDRRRDPR